MGAFFTRAQSSTSDELLLSALVSMDRTMAAAGFTAQIRAAPPPLHTSFSLCYQCRRNYIKLVGKRRMQRLLFETSSLARVQLIDHAFLSLIFPSVSILAHKGVSHAHADILHAVMLDMLMCNVSVTCCHLPFRCTPCLYI